MGSAEDTGQQAGQPAALAELSAALADVQLTVPAAPARYLQLEYLHSSAAGAAGVGEVADRGPLPLAAGPACLAPVLRAERLTAPAALKTVWSVTLDVSQLDAPVPAGDTVGVLCPNTGQDVRQVLQRLELEDRADLPCRLSVSPDTTKKAARVPAHLAAAGSLRRLFTHCVDLRAVPKKPLLLALVEHTPCERQRRRLQELASRQGGDEYLRVVRGGAVSTLQLLAALPSCRPPAALLLEHLPPLPPRPYSASSSPLLAPGTLRLVFSVVTAPRRGLCTTWLDDQLRAAAPSALPVYRRRPGTFRLPEAGSDRPVLMVAAGTGLAPLAGFLQERRARQLCSPAWLVFGCRHPQRDFLLRAELETAQREGALSRLDVVFSTAGGPQRYVQHVLIDERARLARWLLDDGALMFVCGDAQGMAVGVMEATVQAVAEAKELPLEEARAIVKKMQKDGQYKQDVWS